MASPEAAAQGITRRVTIASALWPELYGRSLKDMASAYDVIVIGRVVSAEDISDILPTLVPEAPDDGEPPPPDHPKAQLTPISGQSDGVPVMTRYSVEVAKAIKGVGVKAGDSIPVAQSGGVKDRVAYEVEGSPVIEVGKTYLFFLDRDDQLGWYEGAPFGRFVLDAAGRIQPVDAEWSTLPAVAALTGIPSDKAAAEIAAALAPR
ncbi:MAG: hypothetical protein Q7R32_13360 [Dehalococcoidia bacterium]|nr:hypothetical protein [Dehalococcoidia bacterium]